jgi:hypothetical protein
MKTTSILQEPDYTKLTALSDQDFAARALSVKKINRQQAYQEVLEIMEIERPYRAWLQTAAVDWVSKAFEVQFGEVRFEAELVDQQAVGFREAYLRFESIAKQSTFTEATKLIIDFELAGEIAKRRVINILITGAGMNAQNLYLLHSELIDQIDSSLVTRYNAVMFAAENEYRTRSPGILNTIMFDTELESAGFVESGADTSADSSHYSAVKANAIILPVLLQELGKGLMQIVAEHGLPKDATARAIVRSQADSLEHEIEEVRLGKALYRAVIASRTKSDPSQRLVEYFHELFQQPVAEFFKSISTALIQKE